MKSEKMIDEQFIARDLTLQAVQGGISPKYPKNREMQLLREILCRRKRNKVLILGEHGVGKRVIVESLAEVIVRGDASLLNLTRILELDLRALLLCAEEGRLQEFEECMESLAGAENIILFIEDFEKVFRNDETGERIRHIFSRYLEHRKFRIIATTTPDKENLLMEEQGLTQYFTSLLVKEPTDSECVEIVMSTRGTLEKFYGVSLSEEIIRFAVTLSNHYIRDKYQPDRTLDLLDSACARASSDHGRSPDGELYPLQKEHITSYLEDAYGIPLARKKAEQDEVLRDLERRVSDEIIGQQEAIRALCEVLRVNLSFPGLRGVRPKGIFLLLGPTGVGKTETARNLARILFSSDAAFIRLNMSEYSEPHAVAKITGAPPGYVGFELGDVITERIRQNPHCLLLLDEIEKAHGHVLNLFLQVFDEGKIRNSRGEIVDFMDTVIIMTGNVGAELLNSSGHMGFIQRTPAEIEVSQDALDREIKKYLSIEFINRIDRIILFRPLKRDMVKKIIREKLLSRFESGLREQGIDLRIDEEVMSLVAGEGFSSQYGARYLERKFRDLVSIPVTAHLYEWPGITGEIHLGVKEGRIVIE